MTMIILQLLDLFLEGLNLILQIFLLLLQIIYLLHQSIWDHSGHLSFFQSIFLNLQLILNFLEARFHQINLRLNHRNLGLFLFGEVQFRLLIVLPLFFFALMHLIVLPLFFLTLIVLPLFSLALIVLPLFSFLSFVFTSAIFDLFETRFDSRQFGLGPFFFFLVVQASIPDIAGVRQ